ncbi:MAG: cupin domain-containing protein [Proteobacteria bacterium]|nr:cupin domain-containing protein [Pseudomonadota bacterium]
MSKPKLLWRAHEIVENPFQFSHPFDDQAEVCMFGLSRLAGLKRAGVSLSKVAPGKVSFPLHRHHGEEEWIYILSGNGELTLDDEVSPVGPGDFAAFPAGGPAHQLRNSSSEELVYLMGGESMSVEVADFPEQNLRMARIGDPFNPEIAPLDSFKRMSFSGNSSED